MNIHPKSDSEANVVRWLNEVFPTGLQCLGYILKLFPFLEWLRYYNLQWLLGDLVAGK